MRVGELSMTNRLIVLLNLKRMKMVMKNRKKRSPRIMGLRMLRRKLKMIAIMRVATFQSNLSAAGILCLPNIIKRL